MEENLSSNGNVTITAQKYSPNELDLSNPLKRGAFDTSDEEKMRKIETHFHEIMETLGIDMNDDSVSDTPRRVAKMFVKEVFSGLNPKNKPSITLFENKYQYRQMLIERDIEVKSFCEHHFLPIFGRAHIAYISSGKVIGLSKLNRIVEYYARRPQVQERLTVQIAKELEQILQTKDIAIYIEARHLCVEHRGVGHQHSMTTTHHFEGKFLNESTRTDFLRAIGK